MKKSYLILTAIVLLSIGIFLIIQSLEMPVHTNEHLYNEAISNVEQGNYTEYDRVREAYLTSKYDFEDYGYTLTLLSIPIFVIGIVGFNRLKTPSNRMWVLTIGLSAAILTNIGFVHFYLLEISRDLYPLWADSPSPLMGVPVLFVISFIWVVANYNGTRKYYANSVRLKSFRLDNLDYWYATLFSISLVITIWSIFEGAYSMVLSGIFWIYFYACILLGKREAKIGIANLQKIISPASITDSGE